MGSPLIALLRILAYLLWTIALMPVQALALWRGWDLRRTLPRFYHGVCAHILGLDVQAIGLLEPGRPLLIVANHVSYLDITVLSTLIEGSFVAKAEVAAWPFFGWLAKLQRTVFIDRRMRSTAQQRDDLMMRLDAGDVLILFPEGTSSNGQTTLPFKTALFGAAFGAVGGEDDLMVQPVSITATRLNGMPLGHALRPLYAWFGDMSLAPHLWQFAGLGRMSVQVEFHAPVSPTQFHSRKALAEHCWRAVAAGVERAVSGRPDIRPEALPLPQSRPVPLPPMPEVNPQPALADPLAEISAAAAAP